MYFSTIINIFDSVSGHGNGHINAGRITVLTVLNNTKN